MKKHKWVKNREKYTQYKTVLQKCQYWIQ